MTKSGRPRKFDTAADRQRAYRERLAHRAGTLALWPFRDVVALGRALERAALEAARDGRERDAQLLLAILPHLGITPRRDT